MELYLLDNEPLQGFDMSLTAFVDLNFIRIYVPFLFEKKWIRVAENFTLK